MTRNHGKDARLVARTDAQTHELIARAAELTGRSVSQFLTDAATEMAREAERKALVIEVSRDKADRMLELLDNPEPINSKLRGAALKHKEIARGVNDTADKQKTRQETV